MAAETLKVLIKRIMGNSAPARGGFPQRLQPGLPSISPTKL